MADGGADGYTAVVGTRYSVSDDSKQLRLNMAVSEGE